MHDRGDEEIIMQDETIDKLETVAFHLDALCERLSKDRDNWAVTGGDLAQAVEELQKHIKSFAAIDEAFRKQLGKFIREETRQAAVTVTESLKQSVKEATTQEVAAITKKLDTAVDHAVRVIAGYEREVDRFNKWIMPVILGLGAVLGGMAGAFFIEYIHERPVGIQKTMQPAQDIHKEGQKQYGTGR